MKISDPNNYLLAYYDTLWDETPFLRLKLLALKRNEIEGSFFLQIEARKLDYVIQ